MYNREYDNDMQLMAGIPAESGVLPTPKRTPRIDEQLLAAQTAIYNARQDAEITALLAAVGYGTAQLDTGEALLQRVLLLHKEVQQRYGEQYAATDRFQAAWRSARQGYADHLKRARLIFEADREATNSLRLKGMRRGSFAGWLDQARHFYDNVLATPAYREALAQVSVTEDDLQAGQASVEAAASAKYAQQRSSGDAQHSTRLRKVALAKLARWMTTLRAVARAALAEKPRYLRKLGIRTTTGGMRLVEALDEEETPPTTGGPLYALPVAENG